MLPVQMLPEHSSMLVSSIANIATKIPERRIQINAIIINIILRHRTIIKIYFNN